jgi:hypothetical protein
VNINRKFRKFNVTGCREDFLAAEALRSGQSPEENSGLPVAFSKAIRYIAPMATTKRSEEPITKAELRARKFMGARLQESEARYKEFIDSLDPRERERLSSRSSND